MGGPDQERGRDRVFTETESDRRPTIAYGTAIDQRGRILLPSSAVDLGFRPRS